MAGMVKKLVLLFMLSALICSCDQKTEREEMELYILAGQSNMDGMGFVTELPDSLLTNSENVMIFHSNSLPDDAEWDNSGFWQPLAPGHGSGYSVEESVNKYSNKFGLELSFAHDISALRPERKIALFKYSRGGSSIDEKAAGDYGSWDPDYENGRGKNQLDYFTASLEKAFSVEDINQNGVKDTLIPAGILWMQGESDASFTEQIALDYDENLKELINIFRNTLGNQEIPVVIGRINKSAQVDDYIARKNAGIVRAAQHKLARENKNIGLITITDKLTLTDGWHYDAPGYIRLGKAFAGVVDSLKNQK